MANNSKNNATATAAARLATALVVACMISAAAAGAGVDTICSSTTYQSTCKETLANASTANPKELLKAAFNAAITNIQGAIKQSTLYKKAAADNRTQGALAVCEEVLNTTVDDLKRSSKKVDKFDISKIDDYVDDVKVWLSAGLTCKETCIDAFENTTGDTGEKIKELLKSSGELLSNSLSIVGQVSKLFEKFNIGSLFSQRRLLGEETTFKVMDNSHGEIPSFVDQHARNLLDRTTTELKPDVTVALDGSGQFKTIAEAINTVPLKSNNTYVILIKAGVYKEIVMVPKKANNLVLLGEGPTKTIISGDKSFTGGYTTFHTSTLTINAEGFMAKDIGIENTAGAIGHQAVAVRASGDKAVFYNVNIDGYQDTLYAHMYRQFYRDCRISGTIDFIFGNAVAVFQNCNLVVRKPMPNQGCMVTAQGRTEPGSVGATVVQNCNFTAEKDFLEATPPFKAYLGRPWKEYSRTIIMQSNIEGFIAPEGWSPWMGEFGLNTLYYGEYGNRGPGSDTSKRVGWKGIQKMTPELAESFTAGKLYAGDDQWLKNTGVPYAAADKRTKGALAVCEKVLNTTVDNIGRSMKKVDDFDLSQVDDYIDDVKVWLSAGVTCKDTCVDAFENTTGDTGEKIKDLLKTSGELLSNGLAIVSGVSKLFDALDLGKILSQKRVLGEGIPSYVDHHVRNLLGAPAGKITPNAVVALDRSGKFKTIAAAVAAAPIKSTKPYVIQIKAGVYKEIVKVPTGANNIVLIGEGPTKTIITGAQSFISGVTAFETATLSVDGDDFMAKDIGIENTAGAEGRQAVAVRVSGDKAVFYNVHMSGYQATLYAHIYRQFYRDCRISGTLDIIWGDATAVFQNCVIAVRKPLDEQDCTLTAQARNDSRAVGVTVVQNCTITAEKEFLDTKPKPMAYLGRPMKSNSRTIVMQSNIDGFISPEGWTPWMGSFFIDTLYYGEYGNRGPGANLAKRVKWAGIQKMTPELAESFTSAKVFAGDDSWVKNTAIPYAAGMIALPKPK
ncbi:hypothetical protein C2S51_026452 [Perilla frutescens var. frutescens]|nr:hypothetical protein C2S51_026452 [Perilla frutescens var. frutescens]